MGQAKAGGGTKEHDVHAVGIVDTAWICWEVIV